MEEFVQLALAHYDSMQCKIRNLESENEKLKTDLAVCHSALEVQENRFRETRQKMHKHILNSHLAMWRFKDCNLEELTDINGYRFGIDNKQEMFEMGVSQEEMVAHIKEAYAKWVKENA